MSLKESQELLDVASHLHQQEALLTRQLQLPSNHFDFLVEDSTPAVSPPFG